MDIVYYREVLALGYEYYMLNGTKTSCNGNTMLVWLHTWNYTSSCASAWSHWSFLQVDSEVALIIRCE